MAQRPACARRAAALIARCLPLVVVASTAVQVAMITEGHHGNECCDDGLTALRSWVRGALPAYAATLKTPQLRCAGLPFSAQLQLSHRHASGVNAAFYVTENATLGVEVDGPLLKLQPSTQQFVWAHEISHCAAEVLLDKMPALKRAYNQDKTVPARALEEVLPDLAAAAFLHAHGDDWKTIVVSLTQDQPAIFDASWSGHHPPASIRLGSIRCLAMAVERGEAVYIAIERIIFDLAETLAPGSDSAAGGAACIRNITVQ